MPPPRTSLYREHSSKSQELQRPPEEDSRFTGIIFDGNALQKVTVFVSRKGHLVSFISAPLFLWWFVSSARLPGTFHACPALGFTTAATARTMYAIPITRYPIVPTSFRGGFFSALMSTASAMPEPVSGSQALHNNLLMKEITDRRPPGRWKVRKVTDCRDSLHFQEDIYHALILLKITS
jgi:hypothetical protein